MSKEVGERKGHESGGGSAASRPRFHDARQVLAFTPYIVGAIFWMLAVGLLCAADWIGGTRHSGHLIDWRKR